MGPPLHAGTDLASGMAKKKEKKKEKQRPKNIENQTKKKKRKRQLRRLHLATATHRPIPCRYSSLAVTPATADLPTSQTANRSLRTRLFRRTYDIRTAVASFDLFSILLSHASSPCYPPSRKSL
ncbi:hypothetical protein N657DRAFT_389634 [Parathielavia appendiculata]|uniref:Uncharacterized protein n=1 Tax=Parathielavia appendiculata TaxID=2587402 RepID=A0AAN6Z3M5_9PEZI|nr:hypothetical protein N657DRAFT_389634 [Parathielavia appendiculata]